MKLKKTKSYCAGSPRGSTGDSATVRFPPAGSYFGTSAKSYGAQQKPRRCFMRCTVIACIALSISSLRERDVPYSVFVLPKTAHTSSKMHCSYLRGCRGPRPWLCLRCPCAAYRWRCRLPHPHLRRQRRCTREEGEGHGGEIRWEDRVMHSYRKVINSKTEHLTVLPMASSSNRS